MPNVHMYMALIALRIFFSRSAIRAFSGSSLSSSSVFVFFGFFDFFCFFVFFLLPFDFLPFPVFFLVFFFFGLLLLSLSSLEVLSSLDPASLQRNMSVMRFSSSCTSSSSVKTRYCSKPGSKFWLHRDSKIEKHLTR